MQIVFEFGHPVAVGRLTIHSLEDVGAGIAAAAAVGCAHKTPESKEL